MTMIFGMKPNLRTFKGRTLMILLMRDHKERSLESICRHHLLKNKLKNFIEDFSYVRGFGVLGFWGFIKYLYNLAKYYRKSRFTMGLEYIKF